jgi:tetratricopeptide (TPR) repeat protein
MAGLHEKTKIGAGILWLLLVSVSLGLPRQACAQSGMAASPLDTLHSAIPLEDEVDARYKGADIDISRKKLPDVQATVVPQSKQPRKPPRLKHPLIGEWHFQEARLAASRNDQDSAKENLKQALAIDPDNPRFQWWQFSRALQAVDSPTLIAALPKIVGTLLESPVARGRLAVRAHQAALLWITWFWTVLAITVYLGLWQNLAHDLGAMIFKDRSHRLRMWLPLVIPLAFLAFRPGWLGFLALMSVPLLIQVRGRIRALMATTWVVAIVLVFPGWPILHLAPPTIDPDSEVTLLTQACIQEPSAPLSDQLRSRIQSTEDPDRLARLRVALGIQEARRGRFQTSDKLFKLALQHNPDNFPSLVGLANNTYYRGNLDRALTRYQQARDIHPDKGEAEYNMAQVYFKKLFIPEATAALEQSRKLGFHAPTHMDKSTRKQGYSPVVYPGLTNRDLLAACNFEAKNYPPLVTISAWQSLLGSPPIPLFLALIVPLLLAVVIILWWSHQNDPRECENCGVPLCRDCSRVRETAWLCPTCGETASRSRSDVVLATLLKNRSRDEGMKNTHRIVTLGRLVPGAGHLATNRFVAAWLRLSLTAWGCFLISAGWIFDSGAQWKSPALILAPETFDPIWLPLPRDLWTGWMSLPVLTGLGLLAIAGVIALLDGQNLRQGIPDRFSWAPSSTKTSSGNTAANPHCNQPQPGSAVGPGLRQH